VSVDGIAENAQAEAIESAHQPRCASVSVSTPTRISPSLG